MIKKISNSILILGDWVTSIELTTDKEKIVVIAGEKSTELDKYELETLINNLSAMRDKMK